LHQIGTIFMHDNNKNKFAKNIKQLLTKDSDTDGNHLIPLLYRELRQLAHRKLKNENAYYQIDTTELVHETYIKLTQHGKNYNDKGHFFSLAAQAMRHILVDIARKYNSQKHGEGVFHQTFDESNHTSSTTRQWLDIDRSLDKLQKVHPRLVKVVECRFFGGLTEEETAQALSVNTRTIQRDWLRAKIWMKKFLKYDELS